MAFKDKDKMIEYNRKFNENHYDRISVMVDKGKRDIIKEAAKRNGESVNAFINRAIDMLLDSQEN